MNRKNKKSKKKYTSPKFQVLSVMLNDDTICTGSVENFSSYIADGGDWGDPIFDDDEEINW